MQHGNILVSGDGRPGCALYRTGLNPSGGAPALALAEPRPHGDQIMRSRARWRELSLAQLRFRVIARGARRQILDTRP